MYELISLIIAPVVVGLVIELISRWLDEEDDN
ncbi:MULTISPECIES: type I toxin-antitoxin system Fst family toxin [Carnobacterium]|nr:type I toxin-antitoxin system Fst family toxin [Carnobacterium maltaromaticum]MBC9787568.1 type I toxin-antitoxin system Fst family toxin [Carnobacterium maltaromaticum]MDT1943614.1 type I toxin-antitoxin system Fst family toxin [Carnobacterium maltaromaticum]MDT1998994.1 type I toxin-antitoxin system Fst family toxin [Carnobacterium maltaromaticum]